VATVFASLLPTFGAVETQPAKAIAAMIAEVVPATLSNLNRMEVLKKLRATLNLRLILFQVLSQK
jgi:hypothetical protein